MKIRVLVALALVATVAALMFTTAPTMQAKPAADKKITICHVPPGNPMNWHKITISVNAYPGPHADHCAILDDDEDLSQWFIAPNGPGDEVCDRVWDEHLQMCGDRVEPAGL